MSIAFTIPVWLWTAGKFALMGVGAVAFGLLLLFAYVGFQMLWSFRR